MGRAGEHRAPSQAEEVTDIAILMCAVRSGRPVIAQAAAAPAAACLPGGVPACPPRARSTPAARHRAPAARHRAPEARHRAPAARPIILATAIPWRARRGRPDAFLPPSCMPCHSAPARPTSHAIICPARAVGGGEPAVTLVDSNSVDSQDPAAHTSASRSLQPKVLEQVNLANDASSCPRAGVLNGLPVR